MPSYREIVAEHAPILLIDAASARVHVGWAEGGGRERWASAAAEAGDGIFQCLGELSADPALAGAFVFCEGPGSVLGVRIAAMALRVWRVARPRPVFSYRSLELAARAAAPPGVPIIADARRESWHCCTADGRLRRIPTAELAGELLMPEGFRHWSTPPPGIRLVPYDPPEYLRRVADADIFRESADPDSFLHEEPTYLPWTPGIHRGPGRQVP